MGRRFEIGQVVSGIRIESHSKPDNDAQFHEYKGTWECCGRPVTMKHKTLLDRIVVGRTVCKICSRVLKLGKPNPKPKRLKEPNRDELYNVGQPDWKPTSAGLAKRG